MKNLLVVDIQLSIGDTSISRVKQSFDMVTTISIILSYYFGSLTSIFKKKIKI